MRRTKESLKLHIQIAAINFAPGSTVEAMPET